MTRRHPAPPEVQARWRDTGIWTDETLLDRLASVDGTKLAIIEARNGRAFFPKELEGVGTGFCELPEGAVTSDAPAENEYIAGAFFKNNSRLLVLQGFSGGELEKTGSKCGNYYWEWTGSTLRRVAFKAGKSTMTP